MDKSVFYSVANSINAAIVMNKTYERARAPALVWVCGSVHKNLPRTYFGLASPNLWEKRIMIFISLDSGILHFASAAFEPGFSEPHSGKLWSSTMAAQFRYSITLHSIHLLTNSILNGSNIGQSKNPHRKGLIVMDFVHVVQRAAYFRFVCVAVHYNLGSDLILMRFKRKGEKCSNQ